MKKNIDVTRAWRDEDYFLSLSEEERASLGTHPAGMHALNDEILSSITGGCGCTVVYCNPGGTKFCTPCPGVLCAA
jgi:mersacidin/lichenicidin family type 2 lantibiotic